MRKIVSIKVTGAATAGRSHISKNIPCQDYVSYKRFNKTEACIALADGAGSCSMSHFGSEEATKSIIRLFSSNAFRNDAKRLSSDDLKVLIINYVINDMSLLAKKLSCSLQDLSCTLLFVYVKISKGRTQYIAGHIGDGAIIRFLEGTSSLMSSPESGEFVNETYFISHPKARELIKIYTGKERSMVGFLLMSDGVEHSLLNRKTGEVGNACNVFFRWAHEVSTTKIQHIL